MPIYTLPIHFPAPGIKNTTLHQKEEHIKKHRLRHEDLRANPTGHKDATEKTYRTRLIRYCTPPCATRSEAAAASGSNPTCQTCVWEAQPCNHHRRHPCRYSVYIRSVIPRATTKKTHGAGDEIFRPSDVFSDFLYSLVCFRAISYRFFWGKEREG